MEDLQPDDGSPPRDADIPAAGNDPDDPLRPEAEEEAMTPPIGNPQQDMDAVEGDNEGGTPEDPDDREAGAEGADESDLESELSEIDEARFEDFDPEAINIEERPVAVDESNVNLLKAIKRKRAEGEDGVKKKKKEGKREKPRRRPAQDDDAFSGGEEIEGKRRRKPKADDDEDRVERRPRAVLPENEEDLTPEERRKRALDRAMDEALKKPTRRRKAGGIDLEAQQDELIEGMRIRMTDAAKADTEARQAGRPAMAKLKLLPEVLSLLNRNSLRDQVVDPDTNLLEAVRFFLEPLNDGSLPAYNIQRDLFAALSRLPINKDALVASGIGKVTLFYTKSTKPEAAIKRQAEKLLGDWTRPILKRSDDYRKREFQEAEYDARALPDRAVASQAGGAAALLQLARERKLAAPTRGNRARPETGTAAYRVVPRNNVAQIAAAQDAAARSGGNASLGDAAWRRMKGRAGR